MSEWTIHSLTLVATLMFGKGTRMSKTIAIVLVTFVLAVGAFSTQAATNYWDNNDTTPGFGDAGGTWGAEQKWSADTTGAAAPGTVATTTADDLNFGSAANGLATGTISVHGTNQGFRSITFGAASGQIRLSGGTLNLGAAGSKIYAENASNRIDSVLAGDGGLNKFGTLTHTSFLTTNTATILPNTALSDYHGADGIVGGAFVGGGGAAIPADPYFFTHDGSNATYQLQILDGPWTKCVKVELIQAGPDVQGRVLYAKYINNGSQLGIDFDSDTNVNDQAVATSYGAGGYGAAETILTTDAIYSHFLPPTPASTTIVANASLADFVGADGSMGGNSISGREAPAHAYFFTNNGSIATYQLQCDNGGYTKCVKIELTQAGADIEARVLYAKYHPGGEGNLGFDFDTGGTLNTIVTSYTAGGYGAVKALLLNTYGDSTLVLTGENTYSGDTMIGNGPLVIGGAGRLGSGEYAGSILNAGGFRYESSRHQALSGAISSAGSVTKGMASDYSSSNYPFFLTPTATTIYTNATLADYTGAGGIMGGAAVFHSRPFVADAYFFTNDASTATFQLQIYDGGHTKCVKIELTQAGTNIAGRVLYAKYLLTQDSRGFDFDTGGTSSGIATSYAAGGYGAAQTTLMSHPNSKLTLSAANSYSGGTIVHSGVLTAAGTPSALGSGGGIVVNGGGELRLNVGGQPWNSAGGVGNGNPITVNGGILTLASVFNAGYSRSITINGGLLRSADTAWDNGDNGNYMNNLTLRNGAQVTGHPIRVGNFTAASIGVSGTHASSIAASIRLVNTSGGTRPLTLDVTDVTADTNTDFTISGVILDYATLEGMPIVKTGAGTVVFSGTNTYLGDTIVTTGTLVLGTDSTLHTSNNIVLNGGTLAMGTFSNTVGTLTVTTNSHISLDSGRLAFADSSAAVWTGSLELTGTLGPQTVRFGTNDTALTGEQLQDISLDSGPIFIDESGYLTTTSGTLLIVK